MKMFPGQSSLIIINVIGDIGSPQYFKKIRKLTRVLLELEYVSSAKSLSRGPGNIRNARESPLWNRVVLSEDGKSTNIILVLKEGPVARIVKAIEKICNNFQDKDFNIQISGIPYVVEIIRRNLFHDLKLFTAISCIVFGLVVVTLFRSEYILIGMLTSCINACALTLIITDSMGVKIGILTANIITIIFVLTLSHMVYLTFNWREIADKSKKKGTLLVKESVRVTLGASFWCMLTTLLGFMSLLFVNAKPLRELGISGSIGTASAILMAYFVYPAFLTLREPNAPSKSDFFKPVKKAFFDKRHLTAVIILIFSIIVLPGIFKLNSDPGLFSFFKKGNDLRAGLEYIDKNGGSTPLHIVVRDIKGQELTSRSNYQRLWKLQEDLEEEHSVGSIISLPVILAESKRHPFSSLVSWEALTDILELPIFDSISSGFITEDRISTHFIMRMKEAGRTKSRKAVSGRIRNIIISHGFIPEIISGLYLLQGELASLVQNSMVTGLGRLIIAFFFVAVAVSRSFKISMAMMFSVPIVPISIFGIMGIFDIPIDIISAPAANVAIAVGIDSMIHMVMKLRHAQTSKLGFIKEKKWNSVSMEMWNPIAISALLISAGFAMFGLSSFPPTQRFGLAIFSGTLIAALNALFVLPFLAVILGNKAEKSQ